MEYTANEWAQTPQSMYLRTLGIYCFVKKRTRYPVISANGNVEQVTNITTPI